MVSMNDSRGQPSKTLPMIWAVLIPLIVVFVASRIPELNMQVMSGGEFSAALMPVLSAWIAREWTEKNRAR